MVVDEKGINIAVKLFGPDGKLVIEVDGRYHGNVDQQVYDHNRNQVMAELGLTVLRFSNAEIAESLDKVIEKIESYL